MGIDQRFPWLNYTIDIENGSLVAGTNSVSLGSRKHRD